MATNRPLTHMILVDKYIYPPKDIKKLKNLIFYYNIHKNIRFKYKIQIMPEMTMTDVLDNPIHDCPRIHMVIGKDLFGLKQKIHDVTEMMGRYTSIYVSIGSKMNEKSVQFTLETNRKSMKYQTNSFRQMVPAFLQTQNPSEHSLCIIVDQFTNKVNLDQNIRGLQTITDANIDIFVFDRCCTKQFLTDFTSYIVELAVEHSVPPEKLMICNFVKFLGTPNTQEMATETMIPEIVQKTLNTSDYSDCFYEWFGYRFYLYNFIYNYKKYGQFYFTNHGLILNLESIIKQRYSDPLMVSVIQDEKVSRFWDNVYDLTTPDYGTSTGSVRLGVSLKEYLLENGQLEIV
uniref:Uncharacterized protein n=1 Tax=viral metagenome TaxID=1070528 RepID=A0A6C0D185_9ZZZZ